MSVLIYDIPLNVHQSEQKDLTVITAEQQQQVDDAMELLSAYVAKAPWEEWMVEVFTDAIDYAADMLEISADDVLDYLEEQPLGQMAHAHVFEHFINTETNEDDETVLQAFMRERVQQEENSFSCQYLKALSEAELDLWEVVSFDAGKSAKVRRLGQDEPTVLVPMDATEIPSGVCIAARLLRLPGNDCTFGFGLLPIDRSEAEDILAYLAQVRAEMLEAAEAEEGQQHDENDVEAAIKEELVDVMFNETFAAWIGQGFEE
jgi:hypothetical protein